MRTTLVIDDDVFLHARRLAQQRRVSLGVAVSGLLREGSVSKIPLTTMQ